MGLIMMKNAEHIMHCIQQSLSIFCGGFIRKTGQIFELSNHVGDAKLYQNIKVFDMFTRGRELITAN